MERELPAGASRLNQTWLHLTGKDQWPSTKATVYSCDFTTRRERDLPVGHYQVVVSYPVDGEIYTGKFVDFGLQAEDYFHRGDTLEVRYNPRKPSKFYYPDLRTQTRFNLTWFAVGAVLAILVMLLKILSKK